MDREHGTIQRKRIHPEKLDERIDLQVKESQKGFVAPNIYSLAEAYANAAAGRYAQPFGIYDGDIPVVF